MKKTLVYIFIFFTTFSVFSQQGKFFAELNYNTFNHKMLSEFQQEFVGDISPQIPIQTVDDFPSNVGFTVGYEFSRLNTSVFVSYNSTGGKISYSDFSGVIRLEQLLNGITVGGIYNIRLDQDSRFNLGLKGFTVFSNLSLESLFEIGPDTSTDNLNFNSIDFGIGVLFKYEYPFSFFTLRTTIGYDATIGGKLKFSEVNEAHLINNAGEDVKTGWSGLRTGLGISIPIN